MTIKKLVPAKHPILSKKIPQTTQFDSQLEQLLLDLEDTMYAEEASAICAPQIGISQQVAMIDMEVDGLLQLINPQLVSASEETDTDLEGSVSFPDVFGEVKRSKMIVVKSNDKKGNEVEMTAHDDVARMILHMMDHFEGIVFTQRAEKILNEEEVEAYFENE
ncbi:MULTISPECIES: peptide deformylase [Staphylococcus]|uniref:Peptide deformylase-like n=1 Tax=Staphylococcus hsinchuensis TaxID=3051183 RepID=A0ABZ3EC40_9STAP|nr:MULTISPECIES: peptide deformylase [unclassified Staphylococcus]